MDVTAATSRCPGCAQLRAYLRERRRGARDGTGDAEVARHLASCPGPACARAAAAETLLDALLTWGLVSDVAPAGLRGRIEALVRR